VAVCGISTYEILEYWNAKGSKFLINCVGGSIGSLHTPEFIEKLFRG